MGGYSPPPPPLLATLLSLIDERTVHAEKIFLLSVTKRHD